jgi:hypothetical protein
MKLSRYAPPLPKNTLTRYLAMRILSCENVYYEECRLLGCYAAWFFIKRGVERPGDTNLLAGSELLFTRVTRSKVPEDGILHSHRRQNLTSFITLTAWAR